jgi:sucrose-6-phosphate hydrolase SacC (GH32 family)
MIHKQEKEIVINGNWNSKKVAPSKNAYEMIVEFENISAEEFGLNLCIGNNQFTRVGYNTVNEELYVDRRNSGYDAFSDVFPVLHKGPLKNRNNTFKLHIFVDKCSIEVFGNDGETVLSSKIYPDPSSVAIEFFSNKGIVKVKSIDLWELNPIRLY